MTDDHLKHAAAMGQRFAEVDTLAKLAMKTEKVLKDTSPNMPPTEVVVRITDFLRRAAPDAPIEDVIVAMQFLELDNRTPRNAERS